MEKEALVAAAKELNEVLGLSPLINVKAGTKELIKQMNMAVEEILPEDTFSDETMKAIEYLQKRAKKKAEPVVEEEVEEVTEKESEMKHIRVAQDDLTEEEFVEKEVQDFEDSFSKELEQEMKGPKKKTLKQKNEEAKSAEASIRRKAHNEKKQFISDMVKEAKYTRKEILEAVMEKYPDWKQSTVATFLTDMCNVKYNPLEVLVIKDKKGILSFDVKKES